MAFRQVFSRFRPPFAARPTLAVATTYAPRSRLLYRRLLWIATLGAACIVLGARQVHLDSQASQPGSKDEDTVVDPATSIAFPKTMKIPANVKLSPLTLVGVGVRTVSFLGIKVYSVGFYADMSNPTLKIPVDMSSEDKVKHIVENTSCVIRIVPTRNTSFTHLRDAFMRALNARLASEMKEGKLTEAVAQETSSPLRKLKSLFPNSPLNKNTPLDIFLSAPTANRPRALVFRDLGSIENDWVATQFVLHYFEGNGPSPPLKTSVLENLKSFYN